ncbi:hypothetical protein CW304_01940 [Bacillus sp. UFRGS-B20]|nr:hypothetical protein CW304_01940 [Bacillus sp. UFRGS-B20]
MITFTTFDKNCSIPFFLRNASGPLRINRSINHGTERIHSHCIFICISLIHLHENDYIAALILVSVKSPT